LGIFLEAPLLLAVLIVNFEEILMKTKSFRKYLETRLNKEEIAEIEEQAALEVKKLLSMQKTKNHAKKHAKSFRDAFLIFALTSYSMFANKFF
jgi:arsenate reductase-like glutaredoxin family protein